jgi:hypothetical protein
MIKIRLPTTMSTVLYRSITIELEEKLLSEVRQTLCISAELKGFSPIEKIAGMLTYKLEKLSEFI